MRRVYFAFALRLMKRPMVSHGLIFIVALIALTQAVSVPSVLANLMQVKVGETFSFFWNALMNTTSLTVVLVLILALTSLSFLVRLFRDRGFTGFDREMEWV